MATSAAEKRSTVGKIVNFVLTMMLRSNGWQVGTEARWVKSSTLFSPFNGPT